MVEKIGKNIKPVLVMAKYVWALRAQLLLSLVAIAAQTENKHQSGLGIIADFLKKIIKTYLRSTNLLPISTEDDIKKDKAIDEPLIKKIRELKHLLDDDVEILDSEDKLTLRGNNETTVIEFLPKTQRKNNDNLDIMKTVLKPDPLKSTINKYKTLKDKIDEMLIKENVNNETKNLIIKTLDDTIAHLIERQCVWTLNNQQMKNNDETKDSLTKVRIMTKKNWKRLREQLVEYLTNRVEKENAFIKHFHSFFSNVFNDNLSDRYKIRCQLVEIDKDEGKIDQKGDTEKSKKNLREKNEITNTIQNNTKPNKGDKTNTKEQCPIFILCSSELSDFFNYFYDNLNDTTVNTFNNYASMYIKDVNTDLGVEKNVVDIINKIGTTAETKVKDVFKKELNKFKLNKDKSKSANMDLIRKFIKKTVSKTKKGIKKKLIDKITVKKEPLFLTVKEDLMVNLDVDLYNLENKFKEALCSIFVICNGRFVSRRLNDRWTFRPKNNNEIFVKVQLKLDEDIKNAAIKNGIVKMLMEPHHKKYKVYK